MSNTATPGMPRPLLIAGGLAIAAIGALGGWWFESARDSVNAGEKTAIEQVVRNYLLENPEILRETAEKLREKESRAQLAGISKQLENPFPGAVLGNPNGKVVLVEFADFACTYCRQSVADVEALIAENPELKVVIRELPILSPASADAARMGLAAAGQGRYPEFHKAMYAAGRPNAQTIEAAARSAGLDLDRARRDLADPGIEAELRRNVAAAQQLGFDGTPAWVVNGKILVGAVGKDALKAAIVGKAG